MFFYPTGFFFLHDISNSRVSSAVFLNIYIVARILRGQKWKLYGLLNCCLASGQGYFWYILLVKTGPKVIFKKKRSRLHLLMEEVTVILQSSLQNMTDSCNHLWKQTLNTALKFTYIIMLLWLKKFTHAHNTYICMYVYIPIGMFIWIYYVYIHTQFSLFLAVIFHKVVVTLN